jgi:hypothetical protein
MTIKAKGFTIIISGCTMVSIKLSSIPWISLFSEGKRTSTGDRKTLQDVDSNALDNFLASEKQIF